MKRKTIIACIGIVIILIITMPFPRKVNTSTKSIANDGSEANIEIKGYYLSYLIKENKFKGKVTISPYNEDNCDTAIFGKGSGVIFGGFGEDESIYYSIDLGRYNEKLNHFTHMQMFFDKKFERILIKDHTLNPNVIYTSYNEKYSAEDNKKFFSLE